MKMTADGIPTMTTIMITKSKAAFAVQARSGEPDPGTSFCRTDSIGESGFLSSIDGCSSDGL